ncbi:uncharacterized protein SCHCODRAFT_02677141 [Schizophyllum commune H4-8]|uniref:Fungal-type protein kinase domain-containing protein n=1 Tax=Schizophyllum commune (strain H4-8 / FGSC 9210) TaxID=578458 RepID=D8Q1S5_SCHCM|nr:uncharacterized protein SCHCODRAFT_02677141 [Schizophyllum commune H4-8]KAI5895549.1 hypothetical protein SCHCODRAFT_02677141 [Schizophyllum commune H4-8]
MEFVDAWILRCAEAHVLNWTNGLHHQDPSLNNLTYWPREDNICAALNDWDLTIDSDARTPQTRTGLVKTGTGPYTATDLLTPAAMRGEVQHLYRHDLEAFFYILIWVICCYDEGRRLDPLPKVFTTWTHGTRTACAHGITSACADSKNTFLAKGWLELTPIASWGKLAYYIADELRPYFYNFYRATSERESRWASEKAAAMFEGNEPPILDRELDEPRKVWEEFCTIAKKAIGRTVSAQRHQLPPKLGSLNDG